MSFLFDLPPQPAVEVLGHTARYPVGRIFCVGRNYVAHAIEMGTEVDREAPWYFTKTPTAFLPSGQTVPYPPGTENFHYEMELALAIGSEVFRADHQQASDAVFAFGSALDMTRRDRQQDGKDKRRPWDLGKDVENSAVLGPMTPARDWQPANQRIQLAVNGETRQDATLAEMVWSVAEIVAHLSGYYHLRPGDIILTGTPAGVGPVVAGDHIAGGIDGLADVTLSLTDAE